MPRIITDRNRGTMYSVVEMPGIVTARTEPRVRQPTGTAGPASCINLRRISHKTEDAEFFVRLLVFASFTNLVRYSFGRQT